MFGWVIVNRIDYKRATVIIQWELISLIITVAMSAREKIIFPRKASLWIRGFRPKVVDCRRLIILAVHTTYAAVAHLAKRLFDLVKWLIVVALP